MQHKLPTIAGQLQRLKNAQHFQRTSHMERVGRGLLFPLLLLLFSQSLLAQDCEPTPPAANTNDCNIDPVRISLAADGNNIFCDGQSAIVAIDEDRSIDFDQLIYYWCDGTVDTIGFDEQPGTHVYNISEEDLCDQTEDSYFIRVIGQKFCADGVTERSTGISVGVRYRPRAEFTITGTVCLMDGISPSNASCNATMYQWDFGDGFMSDLPNPSHIYDNPGNYTIRLRASNECGTDTYTQGISVVQEPDAAFTASEPDGCVGDVIDLDATVNSFTNTRWTILPADTLAWCYTDTATMNDRTQDVSIRFKRVGTYTITLTGSNACGMEQEMITIEIADAPVFDLRPPSATCGPQTLNAGDLGFTFNGDVTGIEWTFTGADRTTASGEDFGDVTFNQSGTATVIVRSECNPQGTERTVDVIVVEPQTVSITDPGEFCASTDTVRLTATPAGGTWSGGNVTPDGRFVPNTAGTRNFTYSLSNAPCDNSGSISVLINDAPLAQLSDPAAACDQASITAGDLGFSVNGIYTGLSWTFENGNPTTASGEDIGTIVFSASGTITLMVNSDCGDTELTADVVVSNSQAVSIDPVGILCTGSSAVQLTSTPPGGTWTGTAVSSSGLFDPGSAGAGNYTLTYHLNNAPCNDEATIDVEVVNSTTVSIQDEIACIDSAPFTLSASPGGGTWSGTGITNPVTGLFDPATAGVGTHTPTYSFTDANACAVTASPQITVEAIPVLSGPDTLDVCQTNDDLDLPALTSVSANPGGGAFTWSGPGVSANGSFNSGAAGLGEGFYVARYAYTRNDCEVADSLIIAVTIPAQLAVAGPDEICIAEGTLTLTTNLNGGRWTGPGIDASTGEIDLAAAGGAIHTYTYQTAAGTSCEQEASLQLEIKDPAVGLTTGGPVTICEGPASYSLLGASPQGGLWSGPALTSFITGTIDLTQLTPGQDYTYTYCVSDASVPDCDACQDKIFTYSAKPSAVFAISGPTCINERFQLEPAMTGLSYRWDFGDGNTSTSSNPQHDYDSRGNYTIQLIVETGPGCTDTSRQSLFISEPPVAGYALPVNEGCAPFELQLNDLSSGDNITVRYLIEGDTLLSPNYVFDSITDDRWFTITQLVENDCGLRTTIDSVLVHPYPLARFGIDADEGCSPYTSELINITLGNPDSFYWNLGLDNIILRDFEPTLPSYTTPDDSVSVYTITLVATNECGTDTFTQEITVLPPDVTAFIQLDTLRGCQPLTLPAQSFSTPGSELSWTIIGPDGTQVSGGTGNRPNVPLDQPGLHTIILTATGCGTDADTAYVEVLPAPEVNFTNLPTICLGQSITFNNGSPAISASSWDFGDSTSSADYSPVHIYDSAGVYTVTYTGFSQVNNCPATVTGEVRVLGLPVSAFSPANSSGCPGLTVDFMNNSSGVGPLRYSWNFGDGSNETSEVSPSHTFQRAGDYTVRMITFDDAGCFSDTTFAVVSIFEPPVSSFNLSSNELCLNNDVLLANSTSSAASTDWLVDGLATTGPNTTFTPTTPGPFTIRQIVTNSEGCRDTSQQVFTVLPSPTAMATVDLAEICAGAAPVFSSGGSTFSTGFVWDFADGTGSTAPMPAQTFNVPGDYRVRLIATNTNGCPADTAFQDLTVYPNPRARFLIDKPEDCGAPAEVNLNNTSNNNLSNEWDFGNGQTGTDRSPTLIYDNAGTYTIQLIAVSDFGCRDTARQEIDIFGRPEAVATASDAFICARDTLTMIAETTQAIRYEWYLAPDLRPRLGRIQQYVLPDAGTYAFNLIAVYNAQCRDTLSEPILVRVFDRPVADFDFVSDESPAVIGDVRFINLSDGGDTFEWDLGDGTERNDFEFTHEYDINGSLDVRLIAATTNGGSLFCADTIIKSVSLESIASFEVPDALSPDYGAEAIRVWGAVGSGVEAYNLRVYSPYGELIWQTESLADDQPDGRWDGTINGAPVPQGAYSWEAQATFLDGRVVRRVGTMTVLR
ncbi:PKD domain-containing protein [Neolewinella persica]|uniref:PKD domain-containing protein n=1 Tax=Neolewinella persica TaxID=70998 RepID=UPI0003A62550|nr:PKD domain-containing protein [Neolewinella persica]